MMPSRVLGLLFLLACFGATAADPPVPHHRHGPTRQEASRQADERPQTANVLGKKQKGKASYYARHLSGRKMADGTPLNPASNAAASKTLPLGTKARVKNLENGKSAVVEIRDRGPYVKGRIVDLSPKTAQQLGIKQDGVASVEVQPIAPPPTQQK